MKSLTHAGSLPRGQEKCKKTLQQSPLIDTEAKMASANYSPFFEKGARGIRTNIFISSKANPPNLYRCPETSGRNAKGECSCKHRWVVCHRYATC